ncbi:NAD(P)-dependent dehydrogenase, short-chain alcohol dehydrogenase family [Parafrankia irregularis]|uniref:NAD(P)-dependent dehydrogenase, short-chain alcohol dehydrogenase family n=1 Tax=Parafrankia irregularis TaxID=795642 RepID=A0A0S4QMI6_9ACTN|nr:MULTISPECIES: SDR family oxidoreductase [Parafrankia]MBE3200112.1 SDR family oxidoreductase [Parafrankia sp. CH37]CUU56701.1 NAD(P)-dependent dehydrogenase, short-chain alcohol dehydrogenase family [Parafrankia irregularis]
MSKDVVVVLGVGGMGAAIARRFGGSRTLLLADANDDTLAAVAGALRDEGHEVVTRPVDVAEGESVAALADVAAGLGPVTHVAHTAGLSMAQAAPDAIIRVDLLGVAHFLDEFARVVAPGGAGVVISSTAGHFAPRLPADQERALAITPASELLELPFLSSEVVTEPASAYSLAKLGAMLRVRAAAPSWGRRKARVNSVSPGVISTPMGRLELDGPWGDALRSVTDTAPAGRIGTPDDVADAVSFLLGPQSTFITGTDLLVDGGSVAMSLSESWARHPLR